MKKYLPEYIQNTILFFVITIIWTLVEGSPMQWGLIIIQSLFFGVILTILTVWLSRRRQKKKDSSMDAPDE
ncbi:hypothetical protein KUV50_07225 [Membranicola marinus]|uniref:Uncharacterized protein n=1 Tax=Membranihabitans marinus TaxID=1227546 RepID=A0A953LCL5_9BACT|nr:hypothetical protein [Membranihabitans marinus]MBY5957914.1 hypothetical protein [Membranihabitans marinus]